MTSVIVDVWDRGPSAADDARYEAELATYRGVCEVGGSPWEAVSRLVGEHWTLVERRWSPGGPVA